MIVSPFLRKGSNVVIISSTGCPARIISKIFRGDFNDSINSLGECVPMKCLFFPLLARNESTACGLFSRNRLYNDTR